MQGSTGGILLNFCAKNRHLRQARGDYIKNKYYITVLKTIK